MGTYEIHFCKNIKIIYIYQTFERRNFNVYLGIFVIVSDPTDISKNPTILLKFMKK